MEQSKKWHLNKADVKKWAYNTLLFSTPTIIIFLASLQSGADLRFALGAAYSSFLGSVIDLLKKWYKSNTVEQ